MRHLRSRFFEASKEDAKGAAALTARGNHEADTATAAGDDDVLTRDGEQVGRQELLLVDLNLGVVKMALARRRADLQPERRRLLRLALLLQLREQAGGVGETR